MLRAYRSTYIMTTFTQHQLMFGRDPQGLHADYGAVRENDAAAKGIMKAYEPTSSGQDRERATPPLVAEGPRRSAWPRKPIQRLLEVSKK
ncbi:hypothetical protein LSAT2_013697, partial [Lamellibrachia satsuma]